MITTETALRILSVYGALFVVVAARRGGPVVRVALACSTGVACLIACGMWVLLGNFSLPAFAVYVGLGLLLYLNLTAPDRLRWKW